MRKGNRIGLLAIALLFAISFPCYAISTHEILERAVKAIQPKCLFAPGLKDYVCTIKNSQLEESFSQVPGAQPILKKYWKNPGMVHFELKGLKAPEGVPPMMVAMFQSMVNRVLASFEMLEKVVSGNIYGIVTGEAGKSEEKEKYTCTSQREGANWKITCISKEGTAGGKSTFWIDGSNYTFVKMVSDDTTTIIEYVPFRGDWLISEVRTTNKYGQGTTKIEHQQFGKDLYLPVKWRVSMPQQPTATISTRYTQVKGYWLPAERNVPGEEGGTIKYTDYHVNVGLSDDLFIP